MALCSFPYCAFLKASSYIFIKTWNTEFYIPLSFRQNKSRYKIWCWLELGWYCKLKQSTNKEIYPMEWFWCRYGFILILSIFTYIWFVLRLATMSPCKGDSLTFVDNKGWPWGPALWTTVLIFLYVRRIDINIERLISCLNKHNLHLKNPLSSNNQSKQQSTFKSKQQSMTRCCCNRPVKIDMKNEEARHFW